MSRQHQPPLFLPDAGPAAVLRQVQAGGGAEGYLESFLRNLVHAHPALLPIGEIDQSFAGALAVCTELNTPAGPIDNFLITPGGLPVLVECKLWKNPEARRQVVGQILDYAKELSRWSCSDLQREVRRRVGGGPDALLEIVRAAHPDVEETAFNDAVTLNLRKGRFLLLILGDGIREGVEAIAEYLQAHAGLHFSLGLVEAPVFELPTGGRLVCPRVIARTTVLRREVVAVPEGHALKSEDASGGDGEIDTDGVALAHDPERAQAAQDTLQFWAEFLSHLRLDDPDQPPPRPTRQGYVFLTMPVPSGSCWITIYRNLKKGNVGLTLSSNRNSVGGTAMAAVVEDWDQVREQLGGHPEVLTFGDDPRPRLNEQLTAGDLADPAVRKRAFTWLADRANQWVNVLRPMIRSAAADAAGGG